MNVLDSLQDAGASREEDTIQKVKLMVMKAHIFDQAGLPQKGFSIAIRAASLALKALYLSVLWDATSVLSKILISLGEFNPAIRLLKAIVPQILETEDRELAARSYSCLADAYMGLAGEANAGSSKQKEQMNQVLDYLEKGFDEYSRIECIDGQGEMMAKKATVMRLFGDTVLANDCAAKYLALKKAARENAVYAG